MHCFDDVLSNRSLAFAVGTRFALAGGLCVALGGIVADPSAGTVDPRGQSDSPITDDTLIT